jgi:hypothetical protein
VGGACTGSASAGGVGTGCGGAIMGRGGCGSISPAGAGKGFARCALGALTGRASCPGRALGRAARIIKAGNTGGVCSGGVSGAVLSYSSMPTLKAESVGYPVSVLKPIMSSNMTSSLILNFPYVPLVYTCITLCVDSKVLGNS